MDWLLVAVLAWVVYMIYGIVDAAKNAKQRKTYEAEIGRKVKNKEWRAYKKQLKEDKKRTVKENKSSVSVRLLLCFIITVVIIAVGVMIVTNDGTSPLSSGTVGAVDSDASNEAKQKTDNTIVDSEAITAEFLGFEDHPELGMFVVRLRVTNKTDQPIWVYMDKASVNDEMMQLVFTGVPLNINPGKRGSNGFIFYYKQTSIEKFAEVETVSFKLKVDNQDTMNEIWASPEITLTK